jgi:two-component system sensor histidine kinase/response regulator
VTASREIRRIERLAHLPIVAMTANAMERDRHACLQAGMNDFVAKPVDPSEVWAVLRRWLKPRDAGVALLAPARPDAAPTPAAREGSGIRGLDMALGLSRMAGKKALYEKMLRRYSSSQRDAAERIRAALDAGDIATARLVAHTLKGVSGNVGAVVVQQLAGALEAEIADGTPPAALQGAMAALETELAELMPSLDAHLPAEAGASAMS